MDLGRREEVCVYINRTPTEGSPDVSSYLVITLFKFVSGPVIYVATYFYNTTTNNNNQNTTTTTTSTNNKNNNNSILKKPPEVVRSGLVL